MTPQEYYGDNQLAIDVITEKYLQPGETIDEMHYRVAHAIALDNLADEKAFYELLANWRFVPGGRILAGAGVTGFKTSLSNCYSNAIADTVWDGDNPSIYRCLVEHALTFKYGGGTSANLSCLRPKGSLVEKTGGESSGMQGFLGLFSANTGAISSGRNRRGALGLFCRVDHPDIRSFIHCKDDRALEEVLGYIPDIEQRKQAWTSLQAYRSVTHANLSVLITDEFMAAVVAGRKFHLRWAPGDDYVVDGRGEVVEEVDARELFDEIATSAWRSGEPGVLFYDAIKYNFTTQHIAPFYATNPCGEVNTPAGGACNLGSLNLNIGVSADVLAQDVRLAVKFLDNVVTYNAERHILRAQKQESLDTRRCGLGVMGLADAMIKNGIRYGSQESIEYVDHFGRLIKETAWRATAELARDQGPAPAYTPKFLEGGYIGRLPSNIRNLIAKHGVRNCALLAGPPTGTGGIIAQTSSGIEPIYTKKMAVRKVRDSHDPTKFNEYVVGHPLLKRRWPDGNYPDYVVDAYDIDPFDRIAVQAALQQHLDNNISSTINLPANATKETVKKIYMVAWRNALRGLTIFRDGCRMNIIQEAKS